MYNNKIDRAVHWTTLLVHINLNLHHILGWVYGDRVDLDSTDYGQGRKKMLKNQRIFKSQTCIRTRAFFQSLIKQDQSLLEITERTFVEKVALTFNSANYLACFYFMKNSVNIDGCSPSGIWYLKTIHIMINRVRKWMLAGSNKYKWNQVLDFLDEVALLPAHDDIDMDDFQQLSQQFREAKEARKRDFAATQGVYIPLGSPPAKRAAPPVWDERTGDPDIDDDNEEEEIYSEEGEGVDKGPDTGRGVNQPTFFGGLDGAMDDDFVPAPSITRFGKTPAYDLTPPLRRKAGFEDGVELRQFNIANFVAQFSMGTSPVTKNPTTTVLLDRPIPTHRIERRCEPAPNWSVSLRYLCTCYIEVPCVHSGCTRGR
ncbi:hypothetical protein K3495_g6542 [Podosphaera aphanis]|nr:hypothetical protein K3495_g6542 [Podosphaera aphanis]